MPAQPKVTKRLLPQHSAPRLGSVCPNAGLNPWVTRRPAGLPTDSSLRSASVFDGAPEIKSQIKSKSESGSLRIVDGV